jgi:hypothetical protein
MDNFWDHFCFQEVPASEFLQLAYCFESLRNEPIYGRLIKSKDVEVPGEAFSL